MDDDSLRYWQEYQQQFEQQLLELENEVNQHSIGESSKRVCSSIKDIAKPPF